MTNKSNSLISEFFKHNLLFIMLLCTIVFIEVKVYNQHFFVTKLNKLNESNFKVSDGELYGFIVINDHLISEHNNPNISFDLINDRVRYIKIQCSNPNPDALSQIFYRKKGEIFTERNSSTFQLLYPETTIKLPSTTRLSSLRIDLTQIEGDILSCNGFILNPKTPFELSYLRLILFLVSLLGLSFGNKFIPQNFSNAAWNFVIHNLFIAWNFVVHNYIWIFIILIVLIDLVYPVTITFDSAHYLWLTNLIRKGEWTSWDIIRNVHFPLHIHLSLTIFGFSQIGILIPMFLAHVLLFIVSCKIAFLVLNPRYEYSRFFTCLIIFTIMALDPTVVGYFHTLLTEYLVALIAMLSCFIALKLYNAQPFSKTFYLYSLYFIVMVPLSWHIKQPYIGAAFFPLCVTTLLLLLRKFSWKILIIIFTIIALTLVITLLTHFAWESFLISQGNPMHEERHISAFTESELGPTFEQLQRAPLQVGKRKVSHYLNTINFFIRYSSGEERKPNLTQANENAIIAHRMYFRIGDDNYFHHNKQYTDYLRGRYSPPIWINNIFLLRADSSNFLFTASYLILPIYVIITFLLWIHKKSIFSTASLILGGTSFFNAMIHLFTLPIDRYLFLGYSLNLLIIVMSLIKLLQYLKLKFMSRKILQHHFE